MVLWELDPSVVRPGYLPLVIIAAIGVVVVLLFISMRHQFAKIRVPYADQLSSRRPEPGADQAEQQPRGDVSPREASSPQDYDIR